VGSLPEIAECEAGPELQPIYADIRATAGTAMVNLVYRHIATIPDALPWVWTTLKSGIGFERIKAVAPQIPVSGFGRPLPAEAFNLLGLSDTDVRTAARIVAEYNRANALNLVGLAGLRHVIDGVEDGAAADPAALISPASPKPGEGGSALPPIVPISAMDPTTTGLVRRLSSIGNIVSEDDEIVPSLYRHLAHWPAYLALSLAVLEPLSASGTVESARQQAVASARNAGRPLADAALARGIAPMPSAARARTRAALDLFIERVIPKMLPIGHILLALTPDRLRPDPT
jgi:hypothetical protein